MALHESNLSVNAACDAVTALLNSGFIKVYAGTRPATANTAITTQTLLSTATFNATAFAASVAGVATANAIVSGTNVADGTASFFRATKSDGTVVFEGTVSDTSGDLIVDNLGFSTGQTFSVSAFVYRHPLS